MILFVYQNEKTFDKLPQVLYHYNQFVNLGMSKEQVDSLSILRNRHGKPYLENQGLTDFNSREIHFSISHSGSWWACLMGEKEVGLDIEDVKKRHSATSGKEHGLTVAEFKRKYEAIAKRFFTAQEYEYVLSHGVSGFVDIWIRKEAYIKLLGTGMSEGLNSFELIVGGHLTESVRNYFIKEIDFLAHGIEGLKGAYCAEGNIEIEQIIFN